MRELACEDNDGEPVSQQARDSFGFSFRPMAPKVLSVLQMSVLIRLCCLAMHRDHRRL